MSSAGQQLVAGRIPSERIATEEIITDSATFTTTETVVATVVAPVVEGRSYRVRSVPAFQTNVAGDEITARLREDSGGGNILQRKRAELYATGSFIGFPVLESEYTADATENKTFVLTAARTSGSGDCNLDAGSDSPAYLYVDYIRG